MYVFRLRFVSERADSSETLLSVEIPEQAGSFRKLQATFLNRNITEFSYRHNGSSNANVIVSFQPPPGHGVEEDKPSIVNLLTQAGFNVTDLSGNEMAKDHARHLAGGRFRFNNAIEGDPNHNLKELLYRFEFPEKPGALNNFLSMMSQFNQGWSISLFHYRNHGHDFGRVLIGMLVRDDVNEREAFQNFLNNLGYTYHNESSNTAYEQFLR
jgi:threonine dehydratase